MSSVLSAMVLSATVGVQPPLSVELAGVFLGGLSGSLFAVQRRFPVTGELALGISTALGGGILRDILLARTPAALVSPWYLSTAITAALVGFAFGSVAVGRLELALDLLDPLWMGLFAVLGSESALAAGTTTTGAILVGCVAAVGGGVLRDVLAGEVPQLVRPGPINYLAGIAGSVLYTVIVTSTSADRSRTAWATIAVVVCLRLVALRYGVRAPGPPDLSRRLTAGRRMFRRRPR